MIESKNCSSKFEKVVDKLYTANHINSEEADNAKLQLEEFMSTTTKIHKDKFLGFSLAERRDLLHYFTCAKPDRKGIQYQQRSHYRKS